MNTTHNTTLQATATHGRALVLGGGGSTGNAWLIGMLGGLYEAGLDVTRADLTIGTSAGSTAAAQLTVATPPELLAAALAPVPPRPASSGGSERRPVTGATSDHLERLRAVIAASRDIADLRRRMGAVALEAGTASDPSVPERWRATVAARIPGADWPDRRVLITAVDARSGEPVIFDRNSGVELVDAVAASCAGGGFAYPIGDGRYIDGGYRANAENADLAAGCERVLVLSPLGGRSLHPVDWGTHLADQVEQLRAGGSRVEVVVPESASEHLFGANAMNVALRPAAAQAGYDQGRAAAARLGAFWG